MALAAIAEGELEELVVGAHRGALALPAHRHPEAPGAAGHAYVEVVLVFADHGRGREQARGVPGYRRQVGDPLGIAIAEEEPIRERASIRLAPLHHGEEAIVERGDEADVLGELRRL